MKQKLILLTIAMLATTIATAQNTDTVQLPYTANFTQGWTATGGASLISSQWAELNGSGQTLTSPWIEIGTTGHIFFTLYLWRDTTVARNQWQELADGVQFSVRIRTSDGTLHNFITQGNANYNSAGYGYYLDEYAGQLTQFVIEYENGTAPLYPLIEIFQYDIALTMEGPNIAQVGDTVTFIAHPSLQDGDTPDYYSWYMYDGNGNWMDNENPSRTILSQTDSMLTVVWNASGRFQVNCHIAKTAFGNYNAYSSTYQNIIIRDHFHLEDSIYYTSAAKDTVIGCHPQLHAASLPESVTVIADSAFFSHANLTSVSLPHSLTHIGKCAFARTHGFNEITIPENVTIVGDNAFWYCLGLNTVNFNATNCQTMSPTTDENGYYWPVFIHSVNIHTINIGENVTRIPDRAFSYCSGLRGTLTIPDAVTYIGTSAFYHWDESNTDPLEIIIGGSVDIIRSSAFGCHSGHIVSVTSHNPIPPVASNHAFWVVGQNVPLTVPCGSAEAYRATIGWEGFDPITEDCDGIEDAEDDTHTPIISTENGCIAIDGATTSVQVYDMMGRLVATAMPTDNRCALAVPQSGVYMVKIGDYPARKVVVIR